METISRVRASAWMTGCLVLASGARAAHAQSEDSSRAPVMMVSASPPPPVTVTMAPPQMFGMPTAVPLAPPGEVISAHEDIVVVSGGGWHRGDRVEFTHLVAGAGDSGEREVESLGSGVVLNASPDHARVRLGIDVHVPVGTTAEHSQREPYEYPMAPPRVANVLSLSADASFFLPINAQVGLGVLGGLNAMYRFSAPIAIRASLSPVGGVTSSPGGATFAAHATVSLDTNLFEVGIGAGAMSAWHTDYTTTYSAPTNGMSFSLGQFLRVGAIDGLMLQLESNVYVDSSNQFQFGNFHGIGQVPLARSWWLQFRGGAGVSGADYGEAAVRHLMWGTGAHDSFFLTGSVGVAGVNTSQGTIAGPSVGLGLEWRL